MQKVAPLREAQPQKSALIGRAILNNVGTIRVETGSACGPIIVKGGNHAGDRPQKSAIKIEAPRKHSGG